MPKPLIQNNASIFRGILATPFGKERREKLIAFLKNQTEENYWHTPYGVTVNSEGHVILKYDLDFRYLLKKGTLRLISKPYSSWWSFGRITRNYCVLSEFYDKTGRLINKQEKE